MATVSVAGLKIDEVLYSLVRDEIGPGTGVDADAVWRALAAIVHDLAPKNRALLDKRDALQAEIDRWHAARNGRPFDRGEYTAFLKEIGYLLPEGADFQATTADVDPEISVIAGAQL